MANRSLLVSDVDGTLLGDEPALDRFAQWLAPRRDRLMLAYNSGRFYHSVVESIRRTPLPEPDAIIGGVGTELLRYPCGTPLGSWRRHLADGFSAGTVRRVLADVPGLEPQPDEFQSEFKVSYYWHGASPAQLDDLGERLTAAGMAASVVYSSQRDLDVLPQRADKGQAARYLVGLWELATDQVVVSGDSGNDASLFVQGFRGIVVGNAHDELKQLTGPNIYHARAGFAAGVLEGLHYWLEELAAVPPAMP